MKRCPSCKTAKPRSEFAKNRSRPDGVQDRCKACYTIYQRQYQQTPHGKARRRNATLRWTFGIDQQAYVELLAAQNGGCAICARPSGQRHLHVDHDHATDRVRGLLCGPCNQALGLFRDSPEVLEAARRYLLGRRVQASSTALAVLA
jgi:hypothetical protein